MAWLMGWAMVLSNFILHISKIKNGYGISYTIPILYHTVPIMGTGRITYCRQVLGPCSTEQKDTSWLTP